MNDQEKKNKAAYMRAYRKKNPEKLKEIDRRKHAKYRVKYGEHKKRRYSTEPEYRQRAIDRAKKRADAKREEIKAYLKVYAKQNSSAAVERGRKWKAANPERNKVNGIHYASRRRSRVAEASPKSVLSCKRFIARERSKKRHRCYYCQRRFAGTFHTDHILALALGGRHEASNLAVSCPGCNLSKADKPISELAPQGQRLLGF